MGFGVNRILGRNGPLSPANIHRRIIRHAHTREIIRDDACQHVVNPKNLQFQLPAHCQDVISEFHHNDERVIDQAQDNQALWNPSRKQLRKLNSQVKHVVAVASVSKDPCLVMEMFSPPRLSKMAEEAGFRGGAYDLQNGFDFTKASDRRRVEDDLQNDPNTN